jgi:hypothetical protein
MVAVDQGLELGDCRGPLVRAEEGALQGWAFRSDVEAFLQIARLAGIGILAERFNIAPQRDILIRHMP